MWSNKQGQIKLVPRTRQTLTGPRRHITHGQQIKILFVQQSKDPPTQYLTTSIHVAIWNMLCTCTCTVKKHVYMCMCMYMKIQIVYLLEETAPVPYQAHLIPFQQKAERHSLVPRPLPVFQCYKQIKISESGVGTRLRATKDPSLQNYM